MADGIAFHTPDYEGSASVVCKRLALPSFLWPYFNGAYGELLELSNWLAVGDMLPAEVVQSFAAAYDNMGRCHMIGELRCFAAVAAVPAGCLICDGSQFDVTEYTELAAVLGGDVLPDLRGRAAIGAGPGYSVGAAGGEAQHTLTIPEIPEHWHTYTPPTFNVDVEAPGAPDLLAAGIGVQTVTGAAGGGQPHNNMPPYAVVVWAIVAR